MEADAGHSSTLVERSLLSWLPSESEVEDYVLGAVRNIPASLLSCAEENDVALFRRKLLEHLRTHRVRKAIARFEDAFTARPAGPFALAAVLRTVRHYHNGLRGGLLYLAGRITEDKRLHRSRRDRIAAAAPLFAAFDEFTDNPDYVLSLTVPLLTAALDELGVDCGGPDAVVRLLTRSGRLRKDEPHLERFYGVVDELHAAGTIAVTSDEIDQEDPLAVLPAKALHAYQARRILTTRPDLSYAAAAAFMFGNETVAGLLYGKLYRGFKKFQAYYGLSDHACDYFGDHASEDGEAGGPAFEESHANLMLNAVLVYAELGAQQRRNIATGLHLFLETYAGLVETLCEHLAAEEPLPKPYSTEGGCRDERISGD
jgi:hypothetical protein